ncbi:YybH family protein [Lysobacter sp. A3-1-A15]|uniref:YybH family protein n=2 Tax=Novilysobacter viscosus TaxID=3098602 RepID=UPI003983D2EA
MSWAALLACAVMLGACSSPPPEQRLRDAMGGVQQAIEKRDAAGLSAHLADDFVGPDGMDRDGARRLALVLFRRHRNVGMTLGPPDIQVQGDHATVTFTAVLTGGAGALPESARVQHVTTGWREDGGEWRLTSAHWDRRR